MHMLTIAPLQIIENICKQSETISPFHTNELERSVHNRKVLQWHKPILGTKDSIYYTKCLKCIVL